MRSSLDSQLTIAHATFHFSLYMYIFTYFLPLFCLISTMSLRIHSSSARACARSRLPYDRPHARSISTCQITAGLPAGVFDRLTALLRLYVYPARRTCSLLLPHPPSYCPARIHISHGVMSSSSISNNQLPSLPAGIFDKLTLLTFLYAPPALTPAPSVR